MTMRFGSARSPMESGEKRSLIRPSLELCREARHQLVLQLAALDLAGRVGRDRVDEEVVPRSLEVGEVGAVQAELVERGRGESGVLPDDGRTHDLTPLAARQAD